MKSLSVTEFKSRLSWVLKDVQRGKSFLIVYGRERKPVARIVPVENGDHSTRSLAKDNTNKR